MYNRQIYADASVVVFLISLFDLRETYFWCWHAQKWYFSSCRQQTKCMPYSGHGLAYLTSMKKLSELNLFNL